MEQQPVLRLPLKPTIRVNLSDFAMDGVKTGMDEGTLAFCGFSGADPVDRFLAHLDGELVQCQTVQPFHGWTADIQPGVTRLVLVWPDKDGPRQWRLIGWMLNDRPRRFPIPHHQFNAFTPPDERSNPDRPVGSPRINVVRP